MALVTELRGDTTRAYKRRYTRVYTYKHSYKHTHVLMTRVTELPDVLTRGDTRVCTYAHTVNVLFRISLFMTS